MTKTLKPLNRLNSQWWCDKFSCCSFFDNLITKTAVRCFFHYIIFFYFFLHGVGWHINFSQWEKTLFFTSYHKKYNKVKTYSHTDLLTTSWLASGDPNIQYIHTVQYTSVVPLLTRTNTIIFVNWNKAEIKQNIILKKLIYINTYALRTEVP